MADVKPILVRFPAAIATLLDEHVAAIGAPSRNAAIVDLVTRQLAAGVPLEAAGSPGMASGPEGHPNGNGTSSAPSGLDGDPTCVGVSPGPVAAEGASKADAPSTVSTPARLVGTEAPSHCVHGKDSGAWCYACGDRVP